MDFHDWLANAESISAQLVAWRRDFHQHPELGYEEYRTSQIVEAHMRQYGLEVQTSVGQTGVVGLLRGDEPGRTILLRADMDALPIPDRTTTLYTSKIEGKAHLCGHDAHTSMLMGAVKLLSEGKRPRKGAIKFMFQPAEEGLAGAKAMIDDGLLEDPHVDAAIALHVMPSIPTGRITVVKGISWASSDRLKIRLVGKGGHAAQPHKTVDSILVASQIVTAIQHIASRQVDPLNAVVVTIGQIHGGFAYNVIAPEVEMIGTIRTLDPALREHIPQLIKKIVHGIAETYGAVAEVDVIKGYPPVMNDLDMTNLLLRTGDAILGQGFCDVVEPAMFGEDFAFVAQKIPAVIFCLGTADGEERTAYPLHHPMFDLDERALPIGSAMLSAAALNYLNDKDTN